MQLHPTQTYLLDPHVPNNPTQQQVMALEQILGELQDQMQYGSPPGIEDRIGRLELGFMLIASLTMSN